ncbi:hypothetical protein NFI96_020213, partial [Prochilodus magdalenae]
FVTVLADKQVKIGEDVTLRCRAKTERLTSTWEKNGQKLACVEGKHSIKQAGTSFELEIKNAKEGDEGNYTIEISNSAGSDSCSAMVTVELTEWRSVQWNQKEMMETLNAVKMSNNDIKELYFLLYGPIGTGKSSTINTIKTIFDGHVHVSCPVASENEVSESYTLKYEKYRIGNTEDGPLSLAFSDTMGVEGGEHKGVHSDDIISALQGHIKEGYKFSPVNPVKTDSPFYIRNPSMKDRIHCLVYIIPADRLSLIKGDFIEKMKTVRQRAKGMRLLQVVLMTRVDLACPMTHEDLRNVYKSKKIKDKIRECSVTLGVPETCIFPVCNYHRETDIREDINCLMLDALFRMVRWIDDMDKHANE